VVKIRSADKIVALLLLSKIADESHQYMERVSDIRTFFTFLILA
jgi:hypothetical protein